MCVKASAFRCISTTQDQRIISVPFGSFSGYKCGTNIPTYRVNVLLSGSVRFGLLVCVLNLNEGGNNIKSSLWSLLLKYNPFEHKLLNVS